MSYNQKDISRQVIEMGKQYWTRRGDDVMVLCTDRDNISGNTVVYILVKDGSIYVSNKNGKSSFSSEFDLVEYSPYDDLKEGDIVAVSNNTEYAAIRIFSHIDQDNNPCTFINGNSHEVTKKWNFCRKVTEEELVNLLYTADDIKF